MKDHIDVYDIILSAGALSVLLGIALIDLRAALIVAGIAILAFGWRRGWY